MAVQYRCDLCGGVFSAHGGAFPDTLRTVLCTDDPLGPGRAVTRDDWQYLHVGAIVRGNDARIVMDKWEVPYPGSEETGLKVTLRCSHPELVRLPERVEVAA